MCSVVWWVFSENSSSASTCFIVVVVNVMFNPSRSIFNERFSNQNELCSNISIWWKWFLVKCDVMVIYVVHVHPGDKHLLAKSRWMLKLSHGRNKERERENPCKLLAWCYLLWFREFMISISLMTCFLSVGRHLMNLAAYSMFVLFSIHFFTTPNFPEIEKDNHFIFQIKFL